MRTALLPTPGDPFMLAYWLRNFETWRDEVDELVVLVNGQVKDPAALGRMVTEAGGRFTHFPVRMGHDGALRWLLENGSSSHVVLCEDDAYVRHPSAVGEAFRKIEDGQTDLVGSPRHEDYASNWMEWGEYRPGDLAELRHGLWPAFLFARRADLLATDRVYGDRAWPRGGKIEGWGPVTPAACDFIGIAAEYVHLDTFFGTTFQLRAKGLRTELVHRVRVYDPRATELWVAADPPWFHVTNLSTLDYILNDVPLEQIPDLDDHGGLWTRRVAWWLRTVPAMPGAPERIAKLVEFAERVGMRADDLDDWRERMDPWVTWAEVAMPA